MENLPSNPQRRLSEAWSEEDIKFLTTLFNTEPRPSTAEMARELRRTESAVAAVLSKRGLVNRPDPRHPDRKMRKCLNCTTEFMSQGKHNRLCPSCRRNS